jgi:hypothetical protein
MRLRARWEGRRHISRYLFPDLSEHFTSFSVAQFRDSSLSSHLTLLAFLWGWVKDVIYWTKVNTCVSTPWDRRRSGTCCDLPTRKKRPLFTLFVRENLYVSSLGANLFTFFFCCRDCSTSYLKGTGGLFAR